MLSLHLQRKLMEAPKKKKKKKKLMELATGQHWHQPVLGGYQLLNLLAGMGITSFRNFYEPGIRVQG